MRVCYNDAFGGPIRNMSEDEARFLTGIGFQVTGINSGDGDATDTEIDRAIRLLADHDIYPGPFGAVGTIFDPDSTKQRAAHTKVANCLRVAAKLGCPTIRVSGGSMHSENRWLNHPENHTQQAMDRYVEATKAVLDVAEKHKVAICPETTKYTIVNSVERMCEYVDRCDSPYVKIVFDPVNHMTADRLYDSGRWMQQAISTLSDRIGVIHVKDAHPTPGELLVVHIDETEMGTGAIDHEALIEASDWLEPWKTFSFEHIRSRNLIEPAYRHVMAIAERMGHTWTDPSLSRKAWDSKHGSK